MLSRAWIARLVLCKDLCSAIPYQTKLGIMLMLIAILDFKQLKNILVFSADIYIKLCHTMVAILNLPFKQNS